MNLQPHTATTRWNDWKDLDPSFVLTSPIMRPEENQELMNDESLFSLFDHEDLQEMSSSFENPFDDPRLEPRPMPPTLNHPRSLESLITSAMDDVYDDGPRSLETFDDQIWEALPQVQIFQQHGTTSSNSFHKRNATDTHDGLVPTRNKKRQKVVPPLETDEMVSRFSHHQDLLWQDQFQKLLKFTEENGHCTIPITHREDQVLARWVKRQRYQHKRKQDGKSCAISERRIQLLDSIGFVWDSHAAAWQDKFNELVLYKKAYGHCNIPSCDPSNGQLSTWVKCQRRQYKLFHQQQQDSQQPQPQQQQRSNMTLNRIQALNSLGFVWYVRQPQQQRI